MRGNGLQAESYAAAGDVDRMHAGDALLALREVGVAAYVVLGADGRAEVFADRRALDRARDALRSLVDEPLDSTDEAWAEIVAGYDATAPDPPSAWHLPAPPERPTPPPEPPSPPSAAPPPTAPTPAAPAPQPASTGDLNSPASWEDEGHFVPPPPPPLPTVEPRRKLAWGALLAGPVLGLLSFVLGIRVPDWLTVLLVLGFVGGFVYLVATMRASRDDGWPGDDGAVL